MAVLNVDNVFKFVQFVANKESKGWVSPSEFNISAELAQIAVYSKLESMFLSNKKIHNDMRPFLEKDSLTYSAGYTMPTDWRQILGLAITSSNVPIHELTLAEEFDALDSLVKQPTAAYPRYVISNDAIIVHPATVQDALTLNYLKNLSTVPAWAYTTVSGRPVYDSGNSIQFEFEENLFLEISMLIISNVGMNIKVESLTQYGMAFNQAG